MTAAKRIPLRLKWMAFISIAVLISLLGSTVMLFFTTKASLEHTFSHGNAVQVESATREIRMFTDQYEKSAEQLSRVIQLTSVHTANMEAAIDLLLQDVQQHDPALLSVYYIPASTGLLRASPAPALQQDARLTPVYQLAADKQQAAWTDVRQDADRRMVVSLVVPVTVNGEWHGVVGYDIDLNGIGALRESSERFGKNKLVIYDNQGRIVSSFMDGMDGRNIDPGASGRIADAEDVIGNPEGMKKSFGWVEEIAAGKRAGIAFNWDGVQYNGEVSFVYSMDWSVVSFVDMTVLRSNLLQFLSISAVAMAIGLIIGALAAYYIATQMLNVIKKLRSTIARTAEGDLTTSFVYDKNDEIGDLARHYNAMLHSMRALIERVRRSVGAVEETADRVKLLSYDNVTAAAEVSRATEEIALGASNTSDEVEKSSAAVQQLDRELGTLVQQSNAIEHSLAESELHVRRGDRQAEHLESTYFGLERALEQVTAMVADLSEKSQAISAVTNAIQAITEQTNILSINASIEAARAGQHGKGFAVIANEVRLLADQAKQSTQRIQDTISIVLEQTHNLVTVVHSTNEVNRTQKDAVSQVIGSMKNMNDALQAMQANVEAEMGTIASIESLRGVVVSSIYHISAVSEQTTASTEEIASSVDMQTRSIKQVSEHAGLLVASVDELKEAVSTFKVTSDHA